MKIIKAVLLASLTISPILAANELISELKAKMPKEAGMLTKKSPQEELFEGFFNNINDPKLLLNDFCSYSSVVNEKKDIKDIDYAIKKFHESYFPQLLKAANLAREKDADIAGNYPIEKISDKSSTNGDSEGDNDLYKKIADLKKKTVNCEKNFRFLAAQLQEIKSDNQEDSNNKVKLEKGCEDIKKIIADTKKLIDEVEKHHLLLSSTLFQVCFSYGKKHEEEINNSDDDSDG